MNVSTLYDQNGSFVGNGAKIPQNYSAGGSQSSLLHLSDNSYGVASADSFNSEGPYNFSYFNNGDGPQIANRIQEYNSAPNKGVFSMKPVLREPTNNNPFMNVTLLDNDMKPTFNDYSRYESKKYPSKNNDKVRGLVKTDFEKGLFMDADSLLWNRVNSQRQFYSVPNGSVPNEQGEFSSWLWGNTNVCKSGSVHVGYGVASTSDSMSCNGSNTAEPTNFGLMKNFMSSVEGGSRT